MLLHEASRNLFARPADEHFPSFEALQDESLRIFHESSEFASDPRKMSFQNRDGLRVLLADDRSFVLTNYSLGQIAASCRVPMGLLERLDPSTTVQVLNETWPRGEMSERQVLVQGDTLRALTSTSYTRLWDWEILQEVDRWLLPRGFIPAVPTMNAPGGVNLMGNEKPALFRGDRDSFSFFYSDQLPGDDGLGGMRKGIFVWNSEVGARAFGWSTFYFREVCGNFLVWDVRDVKERRAIHKGDQLRKTWWKDFRLELIDASSEIEQRELDVFDKAAITPFVGDGSPTDANQELAVDRLQRQFRVPARMGRGFIDAAMLPENPGDLSIWGVVNGITSAAKDMGFAGGMADTSALAGKVLQAGA